MNIASIERGIYTSVEVEVGSSLISIETGNSLITFNRSETEQLIKALQQALEELPKEPKYVVLLPQQSDIKHWEYFYLHPSGKILYSDYPSNVYEGGAMTLDEIKAVGKHYEPFAIPAEEFKQNKIGEF